MFVVFFSDVLDNCIKIVCRLQYDNWILMCTFGQLEQKNTAERSEAMAVRGREVSGAENGKGLRYRPAREEAGLAARFPEVAALWHPAKNGGVTPGGIPAGSHRISWWKCGQGHEWKAPVYSLTIQGHRCPYCAGLRAIPGETDLATRWPALAKEWHPTKNRGWTPETAACSSQKKAWWRCGAGHEYEARVDSRVQGTGCPYCAGRKVWPGFNDLATLDPELAAEWHPVLNGSLTPAMVTRGSKKRVWWQCGRGHVWQAHIYARSRSRATGCPVCAKMLRKPAWDPVRYRQTAAVPGARPDGYADRRPRL